MNEIYDYKNLKQWYEIERLPVEEIAKRIGCKWRAVYHALDRQHIKRSQKETMLRKSVLKYEPFREQITLLNNQGKSVPQIAAIIGLSRIQTYNAFRRLNITHKRVIHYGSSHKAYKGFKTVKDYIRIKLPDHPFADRTGYVAEHRYVMEQHIGRYLLKSEEVHHIDGDKHNNNINNLQLISQHNHKILTALCAKCYLRKEIKRLKLELNLALQANKLKLGENV